MKPLIITVGTTLFIVFWVLISTMVCPFVAWLFGGKVFVLSHINLCMIFAGLWIHTIIYTYRFLYVKKWQKIIAVILSLIPCPIPIVAIIHIFILVVKRRYWILVWFPFIIINMISSLYFSERYSGEEFKDDYIKIFNICDDEYIGDWKKIGFANKFGRTVVQPKYSYKSYVEDGKVWLRGKDNLKIGIYSLKERRFILPMGETLRSYGKIEEKEGYYGVISLNGDTLIPFIYDEVYYEENDCIIVKRNGKYGEYDRSGRQVHKCNFYTTEFKDEK